MNLQRNRLSTAIMGIILGSLPLTVFAETQTSDEILNVAGSGGADIELNNTGVAPDSTADWEICTGGSATSTTCNSVTGSLPILNGFHITNKSVNSIGIESGAGSSTTPLLYLDSLERVGINTSTPGEELEIASFLPGIRLNDISAGAGQADIHVSTNLMVIENSTGNDVIGIELDGGSTQNSQLWLDSTGNVSVGKSNPTSGADLEVGGGGNILLENGIEDWAIWTSSAELIFRNGNNTLNGSFPFRIENQAPNTNFIMKNNGNIGMGGVFNPEAALHVEGTGTRILSRDTVVGGSQVLMELEKNGIPAFRLTNTGNASSWDFTQRTNNNFTISKAGSGGFEVQVEPDGDMLVRGSVTANGILLTSSRASKTDFSAIKTADVMEKLRKVEVEEWRYKAADRNDRHISPMAEDFYSLFKLGPDNKHINPNDLASVALIAAKELQRKSDITNAETAELKAENVTLKKRLASLEKLITNLASGEGLLSESGNKIVLNKMK